MVKSVEGVYRDGKVELIEPIAEAEGFARNCDMGPTRQRSGPSRQGNRRIAGRRFTPAARAFAEDWDRPEMNAYDELPPR
jgi:hypothetical protein